jgi:hypothetical protein
MRPDSGRPAAVRPAPIGASGAIAARATPEVPMRAAMTLTATLALILACSGVEVTDLEPALPTAAAPTPAAPASAPALLPPPDVDGPESREDCMIEDPGASTPLLADAQPGGASLSIVRGKHGIAETVRLVDGTEIRVLRGGCNHAGETWSFAPAPEGPPADAAKRLIGGLTFRAADDRGSLARCLDAAPASAAEGWDCGDAYVSVQNEMGRVELTWMFTL